MKKYLFFRRKFEGSLSLKTVFFFFFLLFSSNYFGQKTYTLITSTSDLESGKKYLIVNRNTAGSGVAVGYQAASNRPQASVTVANVSGVMTINTTPATANSETTKVFEIGIDNGSAGNYTLNDAINSAYLIPSTGANSSNHLKGQTLSSDWTITFSSGAAIITNTGHPNTEGRNIIRYNSSSSLFSSYASGQAVVYLYKEVVSTPCSGTPNPGNTLAATNPVVSGGTTILSLQNATSGSGVSYQWQQSANGTSGWTNVSGTGTNPTYTATVTAKTWYRCVVTCTGTSGTSAPVEVNVTYCTPAGSLSCTSNDSITNVSINTLNNTSGCNTGGYILFPAAGSQTTNLVQGSAYTLSLTVGVGSGTHGAAVYIDWNQDGDFIDPSEFILIGNSISPSTTTTVTVNVPSGAVIGNTRMRVRYAYNQSMTFATSCTIGGTYGETEDYSISIIAPSVTPVLTITGTPTNHGSVCPGTAAATVTYTISNSGSSAADGINISSSDSQFVITDVPATIPASGSATFKVTFTPSSAGSKSANISVTSTTSGSNAPAIALSGTGTAPVTPTAVNNTATTVTVDAARLRATAATTFGICPATTEKGFVYSSVNNMPTVADSKVTVATLGTTGTAYNYDVTGLSPATTYYYRAYLFDGTAYTYAATAQSFTTLSPPANDLCSNATTLTINSAAVGGTMVNSTFSPPFTEGRNVWYQFTPTCNGNHTVTVNGFSGDIDIYLYESCPTTTSEDIAGSNATTGSSESFTYNMSAGVTYYVEVNAYNTAAESSTFNISVNNQIAIVTQPASQAVAEGATASFGVSTPANQTSRQWQVLTTDVGAVWTDIPGATASPYQVTNTTVAMNGYKYRAVIKNGTCQEIISNEATLTVNYTAPNNALTLKSCIANNQVTLSWSAPTSGSAPTGYIVFVQPNTTVPAMAATSAGNASGYIANADYSLATAYTTLGKAVYKGNALTATITGLANASQYTFKVVAYRGETGTGWAAGVATATGSWILTNTIDVPEISNLAASVNPTSSTVTWNVVPNSAGCYEYMVVANQGAVSFTPSGSGSSYTASAAYAGANQVVYKGTGNSIIVTGLTDGQQYCYKVFVREINSGNQWSDGVSVCQTTGLNYCASTGSMTDQTSITYVNFNTLENSTPVKTQAYTNFSTPTTTVVRSQTYPLNVRVNTDGGFTVYTKVWFDWNRDGDFADSGEEFDLGSSNNVTDGATSLSPLNITIPPTATLGNVRMRVSSKFNLAPTSCETFTYGEVEDYTVTITQPTNAEINIKGNNISIPNGFEEPYGLNNTLFATTNLGSDSAEKEFIIENLGLANLTLTGTPVIDITGADASDFIVMQQAVSPVVNGINTAFKILFRPTVAGVRQADVKIVNNDSDENPYVFRIQGTGTCAAALSIAASPASGPANTIVTFTSSVNDLSAATVTYNNASVPVISATSGKIEVAVPAGALDSNFVVSLPNGCNSTYPFDVINSVVTNCESISGGPVVTPASDLIIYELYDEKTGSGGVITIFNRTGASVNLSAYSIQRAGDYGGTYATVANLTGTVAANAVAVIGVSSSSCGYAPTGNGSFGATGFNGNDGFRLMKGTAIIDDVHAPNITGYYLRRKNEFLSPKTVFDANEWTSQTLSSGQCLPASEVAQSPVIKNPPVINTQPVYALTCDATDTSMTISASEGVVGGAGLTYQWFEMGSSGSWNPVSDGGVYSGAATATLAISNVAGLNNYQYYCQVRENNATCFTATNAVQIKEADNTWAANIWSNGTPVLASKVIIAGNYDTQTNGVLDVCELTVSSTGTVAVKPDYPVKVKKKITNNNTAVNSFVVESDANLIQVDNNIINEGKIKVERSVSSMNNISTHMDYVYWSSPVSDQTIKGTTGFSPNTPNNGFLQYNEANDRFVSTGDVSFLRAKGYAIRAESGVIPGSSPAENYANGYNKSYSFTGVPHNGSFTSQSLLKSAGEDKGYNLIGNPYPSNIDFDLLYALNDNENKIYCSAFFWTNNTFTPQQMGSGYSGNNYAIYNGTGGTPATYETEETSYTTAPDGRIKVGQAFIVQTKVAGTIDFDNTIRIDDNGTFYQKRVPKNRFWLTMTSPNNLVNTILVGYVPGASNAYEKDFDGELFSVGSDSFYSVLGARKLAIQGKAESFSPDDVVPVANVYSANGNYTIQLKKGEGIFEGNQNVYLRDKLLNKYINLSTESGYTFAAVKGTDANRFEIVYKDGTVLGSGINSRSDFMVYRDGDYQVVKSSKKLGRIELFDASGKLLKTFRANDSESRIDISALPNGVYILKAENAGDVKTKKFIR